MRTLVTGATGLVGRALLPKIDNAVVVGRDADRLARSCPGAQAFRWDSLGEEFPAEALREVETVVHLAGEPVDGRWTQERKRRIRDSRVFGTRALVQAIAAASPRPQVLVSASAVGYYGDRGDEHLDEDSAYGQGFLAEVCAAWEAEARAAEALGVRVVCMRTGLVLAKEGGALPRMLPAFRLGVGGRLGSGRQWMSFIHVDDLVDMLLHACRDARCRGAMNGVAPAPVANAEFVKTLAELLHRPALLPMPAGALRLVFGEMSGMLTGSQRAFPRLAERTDFRFAYPGLRQALAAALAPSSPAQNS